MVRHPGSPGEGVSRTRRGFEDPVQQFSLKLLELLVDQIGGLRLLRGRRTEQPAFISRPLSSRHGERLEDVALIRQGGVLLLGGGEHLSSPIGPLDGEERPGRSAGPDPHWPLGPRSKRRWRWLDQNQGPEGGLERGPEERLQTSQGAHTYSSPPLRVKSIVVWNDLILSEKIKPLNDTLNQQKSISTSHHI